jgi:Fe-S cluster biosynthesis and repair protein YggX
MENSSEFLVLRKQEEIGKELIENQSAKAWTAWLTTNPVTLV